MTIIISPIKTNMQLDQYQQWRQACNAMVVSFQRQLWELSSQRRIPLTNSPSTQEGENEMGMTSDELGLMGSLGLYPKQKCLSSFFLGHR